jgi:hypothetical protein
MNSVIFKNETYIENLYDLNLISPQNLSIINKGVRDNNEINVIRDKFTGIIFLDKNIKTNYEKHGINYWHTDNIFDARTKTFIDDNRRYLFIKK